MSRHNDISKHWYIETCRDMSRHVDFRCLFRKAPRGQILRKLFSFSWRFEVIRTFYISNRAWSPSTGLFRSPKAFPDYNIASVNDHLPSCFKALGNRNSWDSMQNLQKLLKSMQFQWMRMTSGQLRWTPFVSRLRWAAGALFPQNSIKTYEKSYLFEFVSPFRLAAGGVFRT